MAPGYFGRAGSFDDRNGCVQIPDDPSLRPTTQLTLAAWIFPTTLDPASNGIVGKRTNYMVDSSYTMFLWNDGGADFYLWADIGTDRFHGQWTFATNRWYHVAVVFDGGLPAGQRVHLYVDGAVDGEFTESAEVVPQSPSPLYLGCLPLAGPAQEFAGEIDEVAIWTRALGADEILQLYLSPSPL
jgi:hypothetical protein